MVNLTYSQIKFEKVRLSNGEQGMALNIEAMDLVYNKYLGYETLLNEQKQATINLGIKEFELLEANNKIQFLNTRTKDLIIEFENRDLLKDERTKKEMALLKSKLKSARLNTLKVGGLASLIIGVLIMVK